MCSATTKSASAAGSVISTFTRRGSSAVPPLPGATIDHLDAFGLGQFPGQGVFAAAGADYQDFHRVLVLMRYSSR